VVFSDAVLRHQAGAEIWVGVRTPGTEVPDRARVLLDAVPAGGAEVVASRAYDDEALGRVHDAVLRAFGTAGPAHVLAGEGAAGPG